MIHLDSTICVQQHETSRVEAFPIDLWLLVCLYLSIDDIQALGCSCRTLRNLLQDSKSVWSAVVKDLLQVSPYGVIRLSIPRATGAQLRSLAVRYNAVDKVLSTEDISHALETSSITLSPSVKQVRMIPASSVLIHIATAGSLHMTSTKTGESILTWLPPESLVLDHVVLRMESSPTIGTILTVKLFPRSHSSSYSVPRFWLFRVTTSPPTLEHFFDSPIHVIDYDSFDDRIVIIREEGLGASFSFIDILSAYERRSEELPLLWTRLPKEFSDETLYVVEYINRHNFCLFRRRSVDVFVFNPNTEELRRFSFDFGEDSSDDRLDFACPRDLANMVLLPFANGPNMYILHVPRNLEVNNITLVKDSSLLQDRDENITLAGRRYYSDCLSSRVGYRSNFHLRIYPNDSLRTLAGFARLGSRGRQGQSDLKLDLPSGSERPQVIKFDEWRGLIAVRYVRGNRDNIRDYVTIFHVKNLGNDVLDSDSNSLR